MGKQKGQKVWFARGGMLFADSDVWEVDDVGIPGAPHHLGGTPAGAAVADLLMSGTLEKVPGQTRRNAEIDRALQLSAQEYFAQTGQTDEDVRAALARHAIAGVGAAPDDHEAANASEGGGVEDADQTDSADGRR